jgi:hypothetical protein
MWIATTFGTTSTGTAISTLSGAAASQAALAWLGGGAVAAGGAGTAGGSALLALAGPVGWGLAGATLLTSIVLFERRELKLKKQKQEELLEIKANTERIAEVNAKIESLLDKTSDLRTQLSEALKEAMPLYGRDYTKLSDEEQMRLGSIVNNAKSLSGLLAQGIE